MIQTVGPKEAEALIAQGDVDIIDVREPNEFASGHVPGARSVPLDSLKAQGPSSLPRDNVLFVCARGVRSQTAAQVAERMGLNQLYTLEGGTQAWIAAGLPTVKPTPPARSAAPASTPTSAPTSASAAEADPSCAVPPPSHAEAVGRNLKALRTQRGWALDVLASKTGLSRALLGQIELGRANASVSVVWKLADAFEVPFSVLLATQRPKDTNVLLSQQAKRLVSNDGRYSSRPLYTLKERPDVEFYELYLAAHSTEEASPHLPGTRENLVVASGRLELQLPHQRFQLGPRDAIEFAADVPHAYVNPGNQECWMYLVMTYRQTP